MLFVWRVMPSLWLATVGLEQKREKETIWMNRFWQSWGRLWPLTWCKFQLQVSGCLRKKRLGLQLQGGGQKGCWQGEAVS